MKKLFLILFVILAGCSQVKVAETPKVLPIKPDDFFYTKSELSFIQKAVDCANQVWRMPELEKMVLSATFDQTTDSSHVV